MKKTGRIRIPFSSVCIRWVLYTPDRPANEIVLPAQPKEPTGEYAAALALLNRAYVDADYARRRGGARY